MNKVAWDVRLHGRLIDTIYLDVIWPASLVKEALVSLNWYPRTIEVERAN